MIILWRMVCVCACVFYKVSWTQRKLWLTQLSSLARYNSRLRYTPTNSKACSCSCSTYEAIATDRMTVRDTNDTSTANTNKYSMLSDGLSCTIQRQWLFELDERIGNSVLQKYFDQVMNIKPKAF